MTSIRVQLQLRAQNDLAWQAFREGRREHAFDIWRTLLDRDDNRDVRYTRGTARLVISDLEGALDDFRKTRSLSSPSKMPVEFTGVALWLQGEREAACEDWAYEIGRRRAGEITHNDAAGGVQVPALLWWASAHPDLTRWRKLAKNELRSRARTKVCQQRGWPGPLAYFLLGQKSEEALIEDSSVGVQELQHRQRCQAYFYMAAACLDRSDRPGYQQHLTNCLAEGFNPLEPEYFLAQAEMNSAA